MHIELPTPRDMLSFESITSPPRKKSRTTFLDHQLMIQKRMRSEPIHMRLEVEEEMSLMQQLRKASLRNNLNPT